MELKKTFLFPKSLSFDPGSSIKLLSSKIAKCFFQMLCNVTLSELAISYAKLKSSSSGSCAGFAYKLCEAAAKMVINEITVPILLMEMILLC